MDVLRKRLPPRFDLKSRKYGNTTQKEAIRIAILLSREEITYTKLQLEKYPGLIMTKPAEEGFRWSDFDFTRTLSKSIAADKENILTSPLTNYALLTLMSQDPGFRNKVSLPQSINNIEFIECYKNILMDFKLADNLTLLMAQKAFIKEDLEFQEYFKTSLTDNYFYEIEALDFANDTATKSINTWVEEKTKNTYSELIDLNNVDPETYLALLNTMYYNGKWAESFDSKNTTPATFHVNDQLTTEVQMMNTRNHFLYKNDQSLGAQVLKLPSKCDDVNLYVVLPNKGRTIADIEDRCSQYCYISNDLVKQEVDVSLPQFTMQHTIDLKNYLKEFGLNDEAYFVGLIESEEFLKFNNIHHKGFLNINEEGIEAATGVMSSAVPSELDDEEISPKPGLVIHEMNIKAHVSNRFVKTLVVCNVTNEEKSAKQATFSVVLPETAFITEFLMEIEKKRYRSYVKEREKAQNIYNQALASGQSAGLVEASTRDSNKFTVTVNLEPECVAMFSLTYEELLQRVKDQYELVINIHPGQIVENLNVEVCINETRPLKFVKTPAVRSGIEISRNTKFPDPYSTIETVNPKLTVIKFKPDSKRQKKIARYLGIPISDGFSGQFVVQYDVQRDPQYGEILLQDGYFVHFFAPNDLDPLPKHVVFVLDTSTSMAGRKITQLKDAMMGILDEMGKDDVISIVEFNSNVIVWDINSEESKVLPSSDESNHDEPFEWIRRHVISHPACANEEMINKAKNIVQKFDATGFTYIIGALETALYLIRIGRERKINNSRKFQPVMVFLTDGEPTRGIKSPHEILKLITNLNKRYDKVPIFSLSFGDEVDKQFLRELSLRNYGFAKHVYEASDASLQLQEFYKHISIPLLTNIRFIYESDVEDVTRTCFPIYFGGSELVVTGRYRDLPFPTTINGYGPRGSIILASTIEKPVATLERLWAYLTIRELLEEISFTDNRTELTKRALDLALKYSFVTNLTSLVVVKPEEESTVNVNGNLDVSSAVPHSSPDATKKYSNRSSFLTRIGWRMIGSPIRLLKRKYFKKHEAKKEDIQPPTESAPPQDSKPEKFLVDRPFLIILQYTRNNWDNILLKGHVYNPNMGK